MNYVLIRRILMLTICILFLAQTGFVGIRKAEAVGSKSEPVQVVVSEISATSYIQGKNPDAYAPDKMTDGLEETAWRFSTKTSGLKETFVYITFARGAGVDQLWIKNGFWKGENETDQYMRNSRVKGLDVAFRYEGSNQYTDKLTFTLADDQQRRDWQKLNLGPHGRVTGLRLRINSIYPGTIYKTSVCISELMPVAEMKGVYDVNLYHPIGKEVYFEDTTSFAMYYATAVDRLVTRSGPGTEYDGMGTYDVAGKRILIIKKYYDANRICWVQCSIPYRGEYVRAWTGWKRFDPASLDIRTVPLAENPEETDNDGGTEPPDTGTPAGGGSGIIDNEEIEDEMLASGSAGNGGAADEMLAPGSAGSDSIGDEMIAPGADTDGQIIENDPVEDDMYPTGSESSYVGVYQNVEESPAGELKVLSFRNGVLSFQFSIKRLAVFDGLYAEIGEDGTGNFFSRGDWDISGRIELAEDLITVLPDDSPDLYMEMSAHEFIGTGTLIFERQETSMEMQTR